MLSLNYRKLLIVSYAQILACIAIYAQEPANQQYTTAHGLPSNEVHDIELSDDGYLWFATNRGVSRFDGRQFKNFTDLDGLTDNTIHEIYEDQFGRIWFLGYSALLSYYENGKIHPYEFNDVIRQYATSRSLILDFAVKPDSSIYYSMKDLGTLKVKNNGRVEFPFKNNGQHQRIIIPLLKNKLFYAYQEVKSSTHSVFASKGIVKIDSKGSRREYSAPIVGQDSAWFFSVNGQDLYLLKNGLVTYIDKFETGIVALYSKGRKCWIGTANGLICLNFDDHWSIKHTQHLLKNRFITSVKQDSDYGLWISSLYNGVFYIPNHQIQCFTISDGLIDNRIASVFSASDGTIYAGGQMGEINLIKDNSIVKSFKAYDGQQSVVRDFAESANGSIYFVSTGNNVHQINQGKNPAITTAYTGSSSMRRISSFKDGRLVIGGSAGIELLNNGRGMMLENIDENRMNCYSLCAIDSAIILTGTLKGVYQKIGIDEPWEFLGRKNKLFKTRMPDIKQFSDDVIAFASEGAGLILQIQDRVVSIDMEKGLSSSQLTSLAIDGKSIWLGSDKGLDVVTIETLYPLTYSIKHYDKGDGLISNFVNRISVKNGIVWVATNDGITKFDPRYVIDISEPSYLYIDSVISNGKRLNINQIATLSHDSNRIRFAYTGITFKNNPDLFYKYRLVGYDKEWVTTQNQTVEFASLAPGNYRFEIYGLLGNGAENRTGATFEFIITPPFWMTWWFILFSGIIAVTATILIVMFRINQIQKAIEIRERSSHEKMQFELRALRAQIHPHFIFNALASIQHHMLKGDQKASSFYLSRFAQLMRRVLDNSRTDVIPIKEEIEAIRVYLELEANLFDGKFSYSIRNDGLDVGNYLIPSLLIQPYVENAIKHGLRYRESGGKLDIVLSSNKDEISCRIEDNGIGREAAQIISNKSEVRRKSHGMDISNQRIELLGKLQSATMNVEYVDLKDSSNQPAGTVVIIRIPKSKQTHL